MDWASRRVHAVRLAGFAVFCVSVAGGATSGVSCALSAYRASWFHFGAMSMLCAAVAAGAMSQWTSVVSAASRSTPNRPFPAYGGNVTDFGFAKFSDSSLVDVDNWQVLSGSWWIFAAAQAVSQCIALTIGGFAP